MKLDRRTPRTEGSAPAVRRRPRLPATPASYLRAYLTESDVVVVGVAVTSKGTYVVRTIAGKAEVPGPADDQSATGWARDASDAVAAQLAHHEDRVEHGGL